MANNLATGIGLSGQFQLTNEGAQAKLAAERDLYGRKQAEKAAAEKERQKRLSKIMEDSVFDTALSTPRLQRDWKAKAAEEMDAILQTIEEGGNGYSEGMRRLNEFTQYTNSIKAQDEALQGALEMASKDPNAYGFNESVQWDGKDYQNWYQMFNDPNVSIEDFKNAYTGSDYAFVENPQLGREMFMWNPSKRMNEQDIIKSIDPKLFTETYTQSVKGPAGKKSFAEKVRGISDVNAEKFVNEVLNNPQYAGLLTSWEDEITREARSTDPTITRAQLRASGEMDNRMAQKADQFRQTVKSLRTTPVQMQNQPETESGKQSNFEKNYGDPLVSIESKENSIYGGETYQIGHVYKGSRPPKKPVTVREGTIEYRSGEEKASPIDKSLVKSNLDMTPMGIDFVSDGNKLYFRYKVEDEKFNPMTGKNEKEDVMMSIPFTQASFNEYAQNVGASKEDLAEEVKSTVNANPYEKANELLKLLDVDFGGGQAEDNAPNEVKRKTKDGRIAIFNADTKEFIRYE